MIHNPFKWHIVQRSDNKKYGVRKLYWFFPFFGFVYKSFCDTDTSSEWFIGTEWFNAEYFTEYLDIAEKRLIPPKPRLKMKVIQPISYEEYK